MRYVSAELAIYVYLLSRGVYVVAPLLLMSVMLYFYRYLAIYFYRCFKYCLLLAPFTRVFDL